MELFKSLSQKISWYSSQKWLEAFIDHCNWEGVECDNGRVVKLILRSNGLNGEIPQVLSNLEGLEEIDFSNNSITGKIPKSLETLKNLKIFNVSYNKIEFFEYNTFIGTNSSTNSSSQGIGFEKLEILDISYNSLQKLPQIGDNSKLKYVNSSSNLLKELSKNLDNLIELKELDVSQNSFLGLSLNKDNSLWRISSLETLKMSFIGLEEIPEVIVNHLNSSLEELDVSFNSLKTFPTSFDKMINLRKLDLKNNLFEQFPKPILNLNQLIELKTSYNLFIELPMMDYPQLKKFSNINVYQSNNLTSKIFYKLNNSLEELELSTYNLLPSSLSSSKLRYMLLDMFSQEQYIYDLPPSVEYISLYGRFDFSKINYPLPFLRKVLILGNTIFLHLPQLLMKSPQIEIIELHNMNIPFPSEISSLSNLRQMVMVNTEQQGSLPSFSNLNKLEVFYILNIPNLSGPFPQGLENLEDKLRVLRISGTNLKGTIPSELEWLNNIESCTFGNEELKNFECDSASLVGSKICNLECKGPNIIGNWMNDDSNNNCKSIEKNHEMLRWYKTSLNFIDDKNFKVLIWCDALCTNNGGFIAEFSGIYSVINESVSVNENNLTLKLTINKRILNFKTPGISMMILSICSKPPNGWNSESQSFLDFSEMYCKISNTNFVPLSTCRSTNLNVQIDFSKQLMKTNLLESLFSQSVNCGHEDTNNSTTTSFFENVDLRRWWDCSILSIEGIECQPHCGDGVILKGEECDDDNENEKDGCNKCKVQKGWKCQGMPSNCLYKCYDGNSVDDESKCSNVIIWIVGSMIFLVLVIGIIIVIKVLKIKKVPIILEEEIQFQELLGEGKFGRVIRGIWRGTTQVAIKELKTTENVSKDEFQDFKKEANLLAHLPPHPNIVQFLGICDSKKKNTSDKRGIMIVIEFMEGGSLVHFLREIDESHQLKLKPSIENENENIDVSNERRNTTTKIAQIEIYSRMLELGKGITAGMDHLHKNNVLHRDLAARNVLIQISFGGTLPSKEQKERIIPKISDFGLSSTGKIAENRPIPVRWCSPEVLVERKFSKSSDVWSFGIVMFEIGTYCSYLPYSQLSKNSQVKDFVLSGGQVQIDTGCPVGYLDLMRTCFSMDPIFRPTFEQLFKGFEREEVKLETENEIRFLPPTISVNFSENIHDINQQDMYFVEIKNQIEYES